MDLNQQKQRLTEKQRELEAHIQRLNSEATEAVTATEVEDPIDYVNSSEAQEGSLETASRLSDILAAVRAALQRIDEGTYGICVDCDRPIQESRLQAVPWTPYCIEDQEKHDRENTQQGSIQP